MQRVIRIPENDEVNGAHRDVPTVGRVPSGQGGWDLVHQREVLWDSSKRPMPHHSRAMSLHTMNINLLQVVFKSKSC